MPENKTHPTSLAASDFIGTLPDEHTQADCFELIRLMQHATGKPPVMWGNAIIGFDTYHYQYQSGREGNICLIGFSPRKAYLSLYVLPGFDGQEELLGKLGKHKASKGCLYIKRLADVDMAVLTNIIKAALNYPNQM